MFSTALLCALIAALSILRPVDAHVSANPSTAVRGSYAAIAFRVREFALRASGHVAPLTSLKTAHGCGEDSSSEFTHATLPAQSRPDMTLPFFLQGIVTVGIPFNVTGVKPRRVAGWNITMTYRPLNPPTTDAHGNPVNTTIDSISWTALTPADALPNAYYEDFSIQMKLPTAADGDVREY